MHLGNKVDDLKEEATFLYEKARRLEDGIREILAHLRGDLPALPAQATVADDPTGGALPSLLSDLGNARSVLNDALGYLAHLRDYVGPDSLTETAKDGR